MSVALAVLLVAVATVSARAQTPTDRTQPPAPRAWDLSVRGFVEYDDNVALVSKDEDAASEEDSLAVGAAVTGEWRYYETLNWTVGAGGNVFHKQLLDDDVDNFTLTGFNPRLFAEYRGWPADVPLRTGIGYDYRKDLLAGETFSTSHKIVLSATLRPERAFEFGPRISVTVIDFAEEGVEPARTSRDAVRPGIGIGVSYDFGRRRPRVGANYSYGRGFADGDDFDTESHGVSVRVSQRVRLSDFGFLWPVPILVSAAGSYGHVEHVNFVGTPRRESDSYTASLLLLVPLGTRLSADVTYSYARSDSNRADFASSRNTVVFGVTYRY